MNTIDIKPMVDAATDLVKNTVQNVTESQSRAMKDIAAFNDAVVNMQFNSLKAVPGNMFSDMYSNMIKLQNEMLKSVSSWTTKTNKTN